MTLKQIKTNTLLMLLLAIFAGAGLWMLKPAHPHKYRYLALGDSYTIGNTGDYYNNYPSQVAHLLRKKGVDLNDPEIIAHGGWTTSKLLAGMDSKSPEGPFAIATLLIGTNNQRVGTTSAIYSREMSTLIEKSIACVGNNSKRVILISLPDYSKTAFGLNNDPEKTTQELAAYNEICKTLASQYGCTYLDITPLSRQMAGHPEYYVADGMHPSAKGYSHWANEIANKIQETLTSAN